MAKVSQTVAILQMKRREVGLFVGRTQISLSVHNQYDPSICAEHYLPLLEALGIGVASLVRSERLDLGQQSYSA